MIKKILNFTKIEHTAFSLPLLFTGAWLGGQAQWPHIRILLLIIAAAMGARIFGMSFNRIFDRHIDAQNPRTADRELPSGSLSVATALTVAVAGLILYLVACALLGRWCLYLSPLPLIPLLSYSLLKRFTWLCHFGIGLCLALAPLGAFVAVAGYPKFSFEVLLFSGFVFCWLSGADIIYALLDIDSDRRNKIYSLPARMGSKQAQWISATTHLVALICLALLLAILKAGIPALLALAVTVVTFVLMYVPSIPVHRRFFPMATLAGVAGSITPLLA
ncbi:MAG: UbiA-like polyprenyltransferase [Desulfobacteraceae bacterium]|jgi:4-hydroxybenzoate polyprenyltransferase